VMDIPILGAKPEDEKLVEVCRSFAYKINAANHGGLAYESADFFASRKIQCSSGDAAWVSQQIFEECVAEVRASAAAFIAGLQRRKDSQENVRAHRPAVERAS
jgi:hypothetical protein